METVDIRSYSFEPVIVVVEAGQSFGWRDHSHKHFAKKQRRYN